MIDQKEADKKVKEGWLRAWFMFEAIAINEQVVKEALESLLNKIDKDERIKVYKKQFLGTKRMEKPLENVKEGFSQVCEIEIISKNLDNIVQISMEYGPSSIELLEPKKLSVDNTEAQNILNTIAGMMHRFAAAGIGGMVVVKGE